MKKNMGCLQDLLISELEQRRIKNPSFSVRALAKKLNMSHSAVSEIINGKRSVSEKLAGKIADRLMLDPKQKDDLMTKFNSQKTRLTTALQLTADQYRIIADWYHFAILSLSETDSFKGDSEWIARRLELNPKIIEEAVKRLVRMGFLKLNKAGELVPTKQQFHSTDGVPSAALRRTHAQNLELAQQSLDSDDLEIRDFSAMTMAIDPRKIPEARKMLRQFRNELSDFLESGKKTEVYKLCLQLFPLTRGKV